jgi:hypothetical protein
VTVTAADQGKNSHVLRGAWLLRMDTEYPSQQDRQPSDHSVGRCFVCGCDVGAFEVQP